jgi:hypothetical protein
MRSNVGRRFWTTIAAEMAVNNIAMQTKRDASTMISSWPGAFEEKSAGRGRNGDCRCQQVQFANANAEFPHASLLNQLPELRASIILPAGARKSPARVTGPIRSLTST